MLSLILSAQCALIILAMLTGRDTWGYILIYWIINMFKNLKEAYRREH